MIMKIGRKIDKLIFKMNAKSYSMQIFLGVCVLIMLTLFSADKSTFNLFDKILTLTLFTGFSIITFLNYSNEMRNE